MQIANAQCSMYRELLSISHTDRPLISGFPVIRSRNEQFRNAVKNVVGQEGFA
jgi:hypothetical protein